MINTLVSSSLFLNYRLCVLSVTADGRLSSTALEDTGGFLRPSVTIILNSVSCKISLVDPTNKRIKLYISVRVSIIYLKLLCCPSTLFSTCIPHVFHMLDSSLHPSHSCISLRCQRWTCT